MSSCLTLGYFGCGAGLGAYAYSMLGSPFAALNQGTASLTNGTPRRLDLGRGASPSSGSRQGVGQLGDKCEWLNALLSFLWPRINAYLPDYVRREILPDIEEALPSSLKGSVKFNSISLGHSTPTFSGARVTERRDKAIILELSVDLDTDLNVNLQVMRIPVGIKRLVFKGQLHIILRPETSKPPFFAGVEIFFVDPPQVDLEFSGAAGIADWKSVHSSIQNAIVASISKLMVVPARIAVDLDENDDTDYADLMYPEPIGVLRLLLRSATGLRAADQGVLQASSSDPYVVIEVGQQRWKSQTVASSLSPTWQHGNVTDFMVFERVQRASISVWDEDQHTADDLLGTVVPGVPLEPFTQSGQVIDKTLPLLFESAPAGSVTFSTRWFGLTKDVPVKGINPAVARGPSQLLLAVKVQSVAELPADSHPPFVVKAAVGSSFEAETKPSKAATVPVNLTQSIKAAVINLSQRQMTPEQIGEIMGLKALQVQMVLAHERDPKQAAALMRKAMATLATTRPTFNEKMYILLPWTEDMMTTAFVNLSLFDSQKKQVGQGYKVALSELVGRELSGPFTLMPGVKLEGHLSTKWLSLPS